MTLRTLGLGSRVLGGREGVRSSSTASGVRDKTEQSRLRILRSCGGRKDNQVLASSYTTPQGWGWEVTGTITLVVPATAKHAHTLWSSNSLLWESGRVGAYPTEMCPYATKGRALGWARCSSYPDPAQMPPTAERGNKSWCSHTLYSNKSRSTSYTKQHE